MEPRVLGAQWLFLPLADEDVLLTGERVLYRDRRHWAAVCPELWQLSAVVFLRVVLAIHQARGLETLFLFGGVLSILALRPLVRRERWNTAGLVAVGLFAWWAVASGRSLTDIADLLVVAMVARFAIRVLKWALFQHLYVTDRRVMETDGFLGVTVNSMPLKSVTDVRLHRSAFGEILGYGSFHVESAGQEQALGHIGYIVDPEAFHDCIVGSWGPS